jgi:hypothetical protein
MRYGFAVFSVKIALAFGGVRVGRVKENGSHAMYERHRWSADARPIAAAYPHVLEPVGQLQKVGVNIATGFRFSLPVIAKVDKLPIHTLPVASEVDTLPIHTLPVVTEVDKLPFHTPPVVTEVGTLPFHTLPVVTEVDKLPIHTPPVVTEVDKLPSHTPPVVTEVDKLPNSINFPNAPRAVS